MLGGIPRPFLLTCDGFAPFVIDAPTASTAPPGTPRIPPTGLPTVACVANATDGSNTSQESESPMDNFKTFTEALSSAFSDDLFGGIVEFVKNVFGAFEGLLSSTGEGSSESNEGSSEA